MNIKSFEEGFNQLQLLINQLGLLNALLYISNRLTSKIPCGLSFNKYYFVLQSLNTLPLLPEGRGKRFQIRELKADDLSSHPCPRPQVVLTDRYHQGAVCLAAYKDEEFAGCLWYTKAHYQEDELRALYRFPSSDFVWDFDVYVEPKYRLSPVFLKLWDEASSRLIAQRYRGSLSRISAFNPMSLSSHKRMGTRVLGWAVFVRLHSLQLTLSSMAPFCHLSCHDLSFPKFDFQSFNLRES